MIAMSIMFGVALAGTFRGRAWSRPEEVRVARTGEARCRAYAAGLVLLALSACTKEEVLMVTVTSVEVLPGSVSAVEGDSIQLIARVQGAHDERLSPSALRWSSHNPAVATVDGRGLVEARAVGSVTISASFQGVTGGTEVRVLRGPFVQVERSAVVLFAGPSRYPQAEAVAVTNGGGGEVEGLSVAVEHAAGEPGSWLTAALTGTRAPAQLTLTARADALPPGMYEARVRLSSARAPAGATIDVDLSVAGFWVRQTGGPPSVSDTGSDDLLSVALSAQPSADVVLNATSSDPGEVRVSPASIRFTPSNWNQPRVFALRGVDDREADGDQSVAVIISVDVGKSPDAFEGVADRIVTVAVADN
jgi:hypothetical protein